MGSGRRAPSDDHGDDNRDEGDEAEAHDDAEQEAVVQLHAGLARLWPQQHDDGDRSQRERGHDKDYGHQAAGPVFLVAVQSNPPGLAFVLSAGGKDCRVLMSMQLKPYLLTLVASALCVAAAPTAMAQEAPLAKVYACSDIADGQQRLACFDAAVGALKSQEASEGLAVVSRDQIRKAETEAFGLQQPSLAAIAASAAPASATTAAPMKALEDVKLAVKTIEREPRGQLRFVMENGQVWRQTDGTKLGGVGKGPWTAEVRKGALSSYFLKLGDLPSVRAERVR